MTNSDIIPSSARERIHSFIEVFDKYRTTVAVKDGVPDDMTDGAPDADGWVEWKLVDSPVDVEQMLEFESKNGVNFPPLFKAYMMSKSLLMTEFFVILPETPSNDPFKSLSDYLSLRDEIPFFAENELVPFAYDPDNIGPVCFDKSREHEDGDCPIVRVDLNMLGRDASYKGETISKSFGDLLGEIEAELKSYG